MNKRQVKKETDGTLKDYLSWQRKFTSKQFILYEKAIIKGEKYWHPYHDLYFYGYIPVVYMCAKKTARFNRKMKGKNK